MNTTRLKQARRLFDFPGVPRHIVRHNMRSWVRQVRQLGDKWVLAQPVTRQTPAAPVNLPSFLCKREAA